MLVKYARRAEQEARASRLCIVLEERPRITEKMGQVEAVKHASNFKISGCVSCAACGVVLNKLGLGEAKMTF